MPLAQTGDGQALQNNWMRTGQGLFVNQTAAKKKCRPLRDKFAVADALVTVHPQQKMHGRVWSVLVMRVL